MTLLAFFILSYLLLCFGLSLLFPKADKPAIHAWIPGLNIVTWCEIIGRKPLYALWLLFPIVNIFIFCGMAVDMVRSFGKLTLSDSALAVFYAPLKFILVGRFDSDKYVGPTLIKEAEYKAQLVDAHEKGNQRLFNKLMAKNPYKKSAGREWTEAIFFAVFAAAFIRMFLIEAYTIPTSSMEGSLRVGDYLFVSKAHYGIRTPQTLLQIPLLHNRIPIINKESYISSPSLPYFRLPGLTKIKRNDPVVFNWPIGDKIYVAPERTWGVDQKSKEVAQANGWEYVERPMDKTDFYIKRCVAIAGDTLEIINRQVSINGQPVVNPENMQFNYYVNFKDNISSQFLKDLDVYPGDVGHILAPNRRQQGYSRQHTNIVTLSAEKAEKLKAVGAELTFFNPRKQSLFPSDPKNFSDRTIDNYGPIWIPKKGAKVNINLENIALFQRIIEVYEGHKLEIKGRQIFIDDLLAKDYTFALDYYWMMGDNRHNSEDSRFWGYVPETHVVGKPLFIWMSTKYGSLKNGIQWGRLFTGANKMTD